MSSATSQLNARALHFMTTPQLWHHWPFLPLVRRPTGSDMDYGILADLFGALELPGYGATVFRANLFSLPQRLEDLLQLPHETFDTIEEIVSAGWTVD